MSFVLTLFPEVLLLEVTLFTILHGWMGGWLDRWMTGWDRVKYQLMNECLDGRVGRWRDDGWDGGWVEGMDGQMDTWLQLCILPMSET